MKREDRSEKSEALHAPPCPLPSTLSMLSVFDFSFQHVSFSVIDLTIQLSAFPISAF
jgi:hypothetical protein